MHVIAKPILMDFWTKRPDAKNPLQAWFRLMTRQTFADFNALRVTFPTADYVAGLTTVRTEADYRQAQITIEALLDEIGDDEAHPLAEVLDYLSDKVKMYED